MDCVNTHLDSTFLLSESLTAAKFVSIKRIHNEIEKKNKTNKRTKTVINKEEHSKKQDTMYITFIGF